MNSTDPHILSLLSPVGDADCLHNQLIPCWARDSRLIEGDGQFFAVNLHWEVDFYCYFICFSDVIFMTVEITLLLDCYYIFDILLYENFQIKASLWEIQAVEWYISNINDIMP